MLPARNCQEIGCYKYPHGQGGETRMVTEYTATGKADKEVQCEFTDNGTWTVCILHFFL